MQVERVLIILKCFLKLKNLRKKSVSENEKSSVGRASNRKSSKSTDTGTGSSVPDKSKSTNKKSKKSEQSDLEISGTKSKNTISDKSNDGRDSCAIEEHSSFIYRADKQAHCVYVLLRN